MEMLEYGDQSSKIVLIQMVDDHDLEMIENEFLLIREKTNQGFLLRVFKVNSWNNDLSPWKSPAVFGKEDFGEGAGKTLKEILPSCADNTKTYYIGGYSLAGLFALWSACQTDVFRGVAAASPSVWFPGFTEYMQKHEIKSKYVYLSLGDKEEKTRNPVMAKVAQRIREAYNNLQGQNIKSVLEWNEGNHFKEADLRTAKAFSWVMMQPGTMSELMGQEKA